MGPLPLWKLLLACALVTIGCAAAGFGIGDAIGRHMPEYYLSSQKSQVKNFDPVLIGRVEGLTLGLGAGLALSVALIVLVAWHAHRTRLHEEMDSLAAQVERLERAVTRLYEALNKRT